MLSTVTPEFYVHSVLDIRTGQLLSMGLQSILLDVDGTLKDFREDSFSPQITSWLGELRAAQITLCLLSNGLGRRIERLANQFDIPFVAKALKPFPFGCYRAMKKIGASAQTTVIIGDQIFADVLAGRLAGIRTILVKPTSLEEPWFTSIKRPLERQFLKWMNPCRSLPIASEIAVHLPVLRETPDRITEPMDS